MYEVEDSVATYRKVQGHPSMLMDEVAHWQNGATQQFNPLIFTLTVINTT